MASDKIKEDPEKKQEQTASDAGAALAEEARSITKTAESTKPAEASKLAESSEKKGPVLPSAHKLDLAISPELLKSAALKAEMKSQNIVAQPNTKFDWSVVDTVSSVMKKSAEVFASGTNVLMSYLANPVVASIGAGVTLGSKLVKVAEGMYQSADKKLTVTKVRGEDAADLKDDWEKMFNSDAPCTGSQCTVPTTDTARPGADRVSSVDDKDNLPKDMMHWLFDESKEKPEGVAINDNLFSYVDQSKKTTEISALPGHVHIEKRDANGNVETIVDKTTGQTLVLHKGEKVTIENGKEVIQGNGYKVSWDEQGKRHVFLNDGKEVVRDGNSVKILIGGGNSVDVTPGKLTIGSNVAMLDSIDDLSKQTEEARKKLTSPEETSVLTIKGVGVRTIFGTGAIFDVQRDRARLETADHQVFHFKMENDKLLIKGKDGNFVAVDDPQSSIKVVDGKFKIGDFVVDQRELCIKTDSDAHRPRDGRPGGSCSPKDPNPGAGSPAEIPGCAPKDKENRPASPFNFDFRTHQQNFIKDGKPWLAQIDETGSIKLIDETTGTIYEQKPNDTKVKITTVTQPTGGNSTAPLKPEVITVDLKTTTVETDKVVDDLAKTFIKETQTVIDQDRTVRFVDGPTVNPDGSVQVDKHTNVDKDLHVSSLGWESSAAQSSNKNPINEANAQSVAMSIANKASGMFNLAKSGVVRWTEVASLNSALGDVLSLMSNVPVGTPAHSMLMRSYFMLVQAIIEATPKAQAADKAADKAEKKDQCRLFFTPSGGF